MPHIIQDSRPLIWDEKLPFERMSGAESVLPWLLDRFIGMLALLHSRFTPEEAELIVEMHENGIPGNPLADDIFSPSRIRSAAARSSSPEAAGIDPEAFLEKLSAFDEQQLALLRIWAAAYWEQAAPEGMSIRRYAASQANAGKAFADGRPSMPARKP